jgi:hypothetical protein
MFGFEYYFYLNLTYSNPKKRQETFLSFFTNPIVKKSKADTKVKKPYDRNDTRKFKNEWFKQLRPVFMFGFEYYFYLNLVS